MRVGEGGDEGCGTKAGRRGAQTEYVGCVVEPAPETHSWPLMYSCLLLPCTSLGFVPEVNLSCRPSVVLLYSFTSAVLPWFPVSVFPLVALLRLHDCVL